MINFIEFFKKRKINREKKAKERFNKLFSIEYYPLTKRYYPKYKGYYLKRNHSTGIIETREAFLFAFATYCNTEAEAYHIIRLFKEHWFNENVKIIRVKQIQ